MYNDRDTLMKVLDLIMELDLQEYVIAITHIFTHRRVGSNRVKFLRKMG